LLDGVCISGGEPLMHDGLGDFIDEVKGLGFSVKLDTNGSYPQKLKMLVKSGSVDYVALDIKNSPEKYAQTIGMPEYDVTPVEESMDFLRSCGIPYEFRTTVVRELHTVEDMISIARWISDADGYYLQGFVDSNRVLQSGLSGYSSQEMEQILLSVKKILQIAKLRGN